jgi:hypothetical protein
MFLHRKLVGSFLLLARLGAQVDARALILPFLPGARGRSAAASVPASARR